MLIRKAIGEFLRFFWNARILCWLLLPFAIVFQTAKILRVIIAKIFPSKVQVPTCVVGNLRVGGTGKTPFVLWLVSELQSQGYLVAVVSYPYLAPLRKRAPFVALDHYCYQILGDEAALIGTLTRCPIAVGYSRSQAAKALIERFQNQLDFIIFDDGLQCPSLNPNIKIALFQDDHGNGHSIPMGPLRDSWSSLEHVDFLLRVGNYPSPQAAIIKKNSDYVLHHSRKEKRYLTSFNALSAIIAIAYPQALIAHIQQYVLNLDLYIFEDHQPLDSTFYKALCLEKDVIVTQKEWIKMKDHLQIEDRIWILPLEVEVDPALKISLLQRFKREYHEKS